MNNANNDKYSNGWTEWSKHVLLELERLNIQIDRLVKKDEIESINKKLEKVANKEETDKLEKHIQIIEDKINFLNLELATLKMRITMYVAGLSVAATLIIQIIFFVIQGILKP